MVQRAGSRYGQPKTNASLKFAMVEFQDFRGSKSTMKLPGFPVAFSLKKRGRWKWTDADMIPPEFEALPDAVFFKAYNARGYGWHAKEGDECCRPVGNCVKHDASKPIVIIETVGQSRHLPRQRFRDPTNAQPVLKNTVVDERHLSYSQKCACGCQFCSQGAPRRKALNKTKGRKGIAREDLKEECAAR